MISVRPLAAGDRARWEELWSRYLAFYETSVPPTTVETTWGRLLDPAEPVHGLLAEADGPPIGLVHFLFHRSTWTPGDYCYLQDLFTDEGARGRGAGRALIEAVYGRARAHGASRVHWLTQDGNATARALYDTLADHPGFTLYRKQL